MMEDDQDSDGDETMAPPGGSRNRSLRVKFKIPNMKESSAKEEEGRIVKDHYCVECKKIFSSGMALGDHTNSDHAQSNREFSNNKLKSKTKRLVMEPPNEAAKNISGPEFKAMSRIPSHVLDVDRIDSGHTVAGFNESTKWLVTGKRGRAATKPVIDSPPLQISSEDYLAALQLLSLANGDSMKPSEHLEYSNVKESESTSSIYKDSEKIPRLVNADSKNNVNQDFQLNKNNEVFSYTDEMNSPFKELKIFERADENPCGEYFKRILYNDKGNRKLNPGFQTEDSTNGLMSPDDTPYESGTNGSMMIKKKQMDYPESPLDFSPDQPVPPAATPSKYICSTCRKIFPTFQKLGGHRSSCHRRKKF